MLRSKFGLQLRKRSVTMNVTADCFVGKRLPHTDRYELAKPTTAAVMPKMRLKPVCGDLHRTAYEKITLAHVLAASIKHESPDYR
jgi:hypothetical protein